jgi:hypothetical protein
MNDEEIFHTKSSVATLVPGKNDKELSEEFKERVIEAYKPLIALCDEMDKQGFQMQCSVGKNAFGKYQIIQLQLMKVF